MSVIDNCRTALAPLLGRTAGEGDLARKVGDDVALGWWRVDSAGHLHTYSFDVATFAEQVGSAFALTSKPTALEFKTACDALLDGKAYCRGFCKWADAWVDLGILAGPKLGSTDQESPTGVLATEVTT